MNNKPKYSIGDIVRILDPNDIPYATAKITSVMLAQNGKYEYYLEPATPDTIDNITGYAHEEACLIPIETAVAKNCEHTEQSLIRTPKFQIGDNVIVTHRSRWQGMSGIVKNFHAHDGLYLVEINNTTLYFYEHEIALIKDDNAPVLKVNDTVIITDQEEPDYNKIGTITDIEESCNICHVYFKDNEQVEAFNYTQLKLVQQNLNNHTLEPVLTAVSKHPENNHVAAIDTEKQNKVCIVPKFKVGDMATIGSEGPFYNKVYKITNSFYNEHAHEMSYVFTVDGKDYSFLERELMKPKENHKVENSSALDDYPQDHEDNEYRYLSPDWLDEIAYGLTKGAVKHPGETWRQIPAQEHAWRAIRHLMLYLKGDKEDKHLINASMRVMMAFENDKEGV